MKKILFLGMLAVVLIAAMYQPKAYSSDDADGNIQLGTMSLNGELIVNNQNFVTQTGVEQNIQKQYQANKDMDISGIYDDQNPAIVTDGRGNLVSFYECEWERDQYEIGISISENGGQSWWPPEGLVYGLIIEGHEQQPRLDYLSDNTAWGTWIPDQDTCLGYTYQYKITDFKDPGKWLGCITDHTHTGLGILTSIDIGCYDGPNKPNPSFWGLLGFTGNICRGIDEEENTLMYEWWVDGEVRNLNYFYDLGFDFFNISLDIDQSNGNFIFGADYVNESDSNDYGILILSWQLSSGNDWWKGGWPGFQLCQCSNPNVDAKDGRFYIVAENRFFNKNGDSDIVCFTSTNPQDYYSWEGYNITTDIGSEMYPTISAENDNEATVIFTKDGNLFTSKTKDGGKTWSSPRQINDVSGTVVEQYGCASLADKYAVWTDNRDGDNDIYFDKVNVKAKDINSDESLWSDPLPVSMPKNKLINTPFLTFLENHPRLFPWLRHLLEL